MLAVFRRLGSIQFDPLAVAGRNHDLVLHARVANYDSAWGDQLLYQRRALFEAYNKGFSLLPISELPWYLRPRSVRAPKILAENAEVAKQVLERIRADGPLSVVDFERGPAVESLWGWSWAPETVTRSVLDAYAISGVLGIARRNGNRRYFDLVERLFPSELLEQKVTLRDQLRHKVMSRFRAHGLLGIAGAGDVWHGIGPARPDPKQPDRSSRSELREELVEAGEIVPVDIEGLRGQRFVLREEVALLTAPPDPPPSVAFLAPLDPFVWDRDLLGRLFDFEQVWEVYVPEHKRRWGYYVLPVLYRDRIVGRIEPRIDRARGSVRVLGLWWEEGFAPNRVSGFVEAMREALSSYLSFAGASRFEWADHLSADRRLFSRG